MTDGQAKGQPTLLPQVPLPPSALDEEKRDRGGEDQQRQHDEDQQRLRIHYDLLVSLGPMTSRFYPADRVPKPGRSVGLFRRRLHQAS